MKDHKVAYKVVEKGTRHCSNWCLFKGDTEEYSKEELKNWTKFRRAHKQFFPRYLRGSTIRAPKSSVGIMCFVSHSRAKQFQDSYYELKNNAKIIKVEGIGQREGEFLLAPNVGTNPSNVVFARPAATAPPGTVRFDKVVVLE